MKNRKTELQWKVKSQSGQESDDLRSTKVEATVNTGERGERNGISSEATHQPMNAWFACEALPTSACSDEDREVCMEASFSSWLST